MAKGNAEPSDRRDPKRGSYVVIARRYRPQTFADLVGQQQVSQALTNAIATNRVGHAYLFTGARGIGKTSAARIFAKALNCIQGPTPQPCNACDICVSVSSGEDVDVLEIDGASNRGIDEIRQLRSNVNIRPSRARFKIYIIDEVHMLTVPAFNALLKTLEEPPEHVKFIFCTTDPEKVPITVLSRCQRFDFPPVETAAIVERLQTIVAAERATATEEALHLLARRASGSMRDSQSLLEQLLAFCSQEITTADVHRLLGTAPSSRLAALMGHIIARSTAGALKELDEAIAEGVDAGQLTEQMLGYLRDIMAALVGCPADMMFSSTREEFAALVEAGQQLGLETILAIVQILDQTLTRMRQSTHTRILLEVAVVRICNLEHLEALPQLITQLRQGHLAGTPIGPASSGPAAGTVPAGTPPATPTPQKKKPLEPESPAPSAEPVLNRQPLTSETAEQLWKQALALLEDMTADHGERYERVAISAPNRLVVTFPERYTLDKERCERPERKVRIEKALQQLTGELVRVEFELVRDPAEPSEPVPAPSRRQKLKQKEAHPLVRQAMDLFQAEITDLEEPREQQSP
jgi:DNA polymerase-3 subunit gamma/tau